MPRAATLKADNPPFVHGPITDPLKLPYAKKLSEVRTLRLNEAFRILVTCAACALTVGQQEDLYLQTIKGLDRHDLETICHSFALLQQDMQQRPYRDLLGPVYMEIGHQLDRKHGAEFFTPHAISYLMAKMTYGQNTHSMFPADKPLDCGEPACGSGGMILAATQVFVEAGISPLHTRWVAQDISNTSCYSTFVNTSLWGIPALVKCGNTLSSDPPRWQWSNVFWHQARPLPDAAWIQRTRKVFDFIQGMAAETFEVAPQKPAVQASVQPATTEPRQPAPFGPEFGPLFGSEA